MQDYRLFYKDPETGDWALQFLSENKGLAAGGIATIGAIYIYISEQPNRAKKAGATIKLLKQLRRFF